MLQYSCDLVWLLPSNRMKLPHQYQTRIERPIKITVRLTNSTGRARAISWDHILQNKTLGPLIMIARGNIIRLSSIRCFQVPKTVNKKKMTSLRMNKHPRVRRMEISCGILYRTIEILPSRNACEWPLNNLRGR